MTLVHVRPLLSTEKISYSSSNLKLSSLRQLRFWVLIACKNIRFSLALRRWGRFARRNVCDSGQKFHTDDANQCFHNKSGSHGVPNMNLYNFTCLLVDSGKGLCSSANEPQQNSNASSREHNIPQMLTVLSETLRVYIWPLWPFVFCLLRLPFSASHRIPDRFYVISMEFSVAETQTFLLARRPQWRRARRDGCFRRLEKWLQ